MRFRVRLAIALVALLLVAGTRDPKIDDEAYLAAGESHSDYTLALDAVDEDGSMGCGTAVAISDTWMLTAAHVVHEAQAATVRCRRGVWPIRRIVVHPRFQHAMMGMHDIALLESESPLGLDSYPLLADGSEQVGDSAIIVGYGASGPLDTGYDTVDGKIRAGTNTICRTERSLWVCHGAAGTSAMEILVAPGDSGGPLIVRGRVVGINSLLMRDGRGAVKGTTGQESGHTRVVDYLDWIKTVVSGTDLAWTQ